jgi:uncharacterized protein DUF4136
MRRYFPMLVFVLLPMLSLAQKVTVEFDQSADFSQFKTFTIRQGRLNSKNPALNSDLVRQKIDAEIRNRLTAKGLTEVEARPDLNVRYTLGAAQRRQVEAYPAGWRGLGTRIVRVPYAEGTLVLDLRDPKRQALVWRAIATEDKSNATKIADHLEDMVRKSIDRYPPKAK